MSWKGACCKPDKLSAVLKFTWKERTEFCKLFCLDVFIPDFILKFLQFNFSYLGS